MMDICMVLILVACFISVKFFADWCERQVNTLHAKEEER